MKLLFCFLLAALCYTSAVEIENGLENSEIEEIDLDFEDLEPGVVEGDFDNDIELTEEDLETEENEIDDTVDEEVEEVQLGETMLMPDDEGRLHVASLREEDDLTFKVTASDVHYYLYTRAAGAAQSVPTMTHLSKSRFKKTRTNVFIIHGWKSKHSSPVNTLNKAAILKKYDANVFVVDWSKPASTLNYASAKGAVPTVGIMVGKYISNMMKKYALPGSKFIIIGHSLGAHVSGCAGAAAKKHSGKKVSHIIGLDPAGPLFTKKNTANRLDKGDASFVHVIHTSSRLGFGSACGHADYYPNGGKKQPGCGTDVTRSCSHGRAYQLLAGSINKQNFQAVRCASFDSFKKGQCKKNPKSHLGGLLVHRTASGNYYLKTRASSPFGLGPI